MALQRASSSAGCGALRPAGRSSTARAPLTPRENEDVLAAAGVTPVSLERTLPHRDGTEGFYDRRAEALMRQDGGMDLGPTLPGLRGAVAAADEPRRAATAACTACTASSSSRCARSAASTRRSCACPTRRSCAASTATPRCCSRYEPDPRLAPSILSADFARLGDQVRLVVDAGAQRDPRRRHGRALRPADHARAARRRRAARRPRATTSSSTATS